MVTALLPTDKRCTGLIIIGSECVTVRRKYATTSWLYLIWHFVVVSAPQVPLFGTIEPTDQNC